MNLPGRLKLTTLGDLLGALHREGASGVLELVEQEGSTGERAHRVFLDRGLVDAVESKITAPKLGELLVREGLLTLDGVRRLLRRLVEQPNKKAGEILVEEQLLEPGLLEAALRLQLRKRLDTLFRLSDAMVRFHVRRPRAAQGQREVPLTPREFLYGRPRARVRSAAAAQARGGARAQVPAPVTDEARASAYRELGLHPSADSETVRRTFRKLAALHHPDRYPQASAQQRVALVQRFSRISAAYHRICE